jgi:hypothetical protein
MCFGLVAASRDAPVFGREPANVIRIGDDAIYKAVARDKSPMAQCNITSSALFVTAILLSVREIR